MPAARVEWSCSHSTGLCGRLPHPLGRKPPPPFCFRLHSPRLSIAVPRTALDGLVILLACLACYQRAGVQGRVPDVLAVGSPLLFLPLSQAPTFLTASHLTPPAPDFASTAPVTITRGKSLNAYFFHLSVPPINRVKYTVNAYRTANAYQTRPVCQKLCSALSRHRCILRPLWRKVCSLSPLRR